MLTQLRERYEELTQYGFQVIVITPSIGAFLEPFQKAFGPFPFPIYGDPKRELYRSLGHITMNKWKLLYKALKLFFTGGSKSFLPKNVEQRKLVQKAMKTHDVFIQGGTWLFNEHGKTLWKHVDSSPEDHATIDKILEEMKCHSK
ncbi:AhpC/TSA family protein [Bacillus sp. RD4P76]|uniref:AhpC/TSA family protein n=1 Tax=Bacillus suaedaesalsae TaxID=2810349 RepID=A0ABS2DLC5_9BACI|nr:peroxiredoxin-like family protein [Bacillus suaedaesalsae]MBM6618840.1 AhpC/TSA family protein [Bacillus suaedaesalsae]